jgi:hypothetical protein
MKKRQNIEFDDELREEYDFKELLKGAVRDKYATTRSPDVPTDGMPR